MAGHGFTVREAEEHLPGGERRGTVLMLPGRQRLRSEEVNIACERGTFGPDGVAQARRILGSRDAPRRRGIELSEAEMDPVDASGVVVPFDLDEDSVIDAVAVDVDGNGAADVVAVDLDADAVAVGVVVVDTDGDALPDVAVFDLAEDTQPTDEAGYVPGWQPEEGTGLEGDSFTPPDEVTNEDVDQAMQDVQHSQAMNQYMTDLGVID